MARELKTGYNKFPPALRQLTPQFPTDGADGLLVGCRILVAACAGGRWQAAAVILSGHRRQRSDPEEPAGAEGEGPGCERRFLLRVHVDALSGDE